MAARMHDVFAFEQAAVIRFDGLQRARVIALDPPLPGFDREIEFGPDDATAAGIVARTGTAAVTAYGLDSAGTAAFLYTSGLRSGAAAPIRVHGRLWGAVSLGARNPDAVDRDVVDRLSSFAEMVEIAIGSAAAWSELTRRATTDPITGLPNHRSFHEHLARELAETKRTNRPLASCSSTSTTSSGSTTRSAIRSAIASSARSGGASTGSSASMRSSPGSAARSSPGCSPRPTPRRNTRPRNAPAG